MNLNPFTTIRELRDQLAAAQRRINSYHADLTAASLEVRVLRMELEQKNSALADALARAKKKPGPKPKAETPAAEQPE